MNIEFYHESVARFCERLDCNLATGLDEGEAERGITVCWTGNGMNMAANKVRGVRAGMAINPEMAHMTRLHNNANVLSLAAKYTPVDSLEETVRLFVETDFEGGRHISRIERFMQEEKCD